MSITKQSGALRALVSQFVRLRHHNAQTNVQTIGEPEQSAELWITCAPDECIDLLDFQIRISRYRVLVDVGVFGYQHFYRMTQCCIVGAAWLGFPFRWHEREVYSSRRDKNRAYFGYYGCRQSSTLQFGSFSVSEPFERSQRLFGQAFQQIREEQGVSVSALAQTAGVASTRIRALEAGILDPDYELLLVLAEGLGVSASAFVLRLEDLDKAARHED